MRWLCWALLMAAPAGAQVPTPPSTDTLSMWIIRGTDTVPVGRQIHQLSLRRESGVTLLFRVVATDAPLFGPRIDTIISQNDTGLPVRSVVVTPWATERVDVIGGRARGRITGPDNVVVDLDVKVPEGTIHMANIDLALRQRLLPLGGILTLRVFIPAPGGGGEIQMRVEGVEAIGTEWVWRIRALNLANALTLWISQADRSLVRHALVGPNGAELLFDRRPLPALPSRP